MARRASHKLPIARSEGLLTEEIGSEIVVYETETMEAHCLSPLAAAVFAGCDGRTTTEELAKRAGTRVGEPVSVADVEAALTQLDERKLLASPAGRMTRRRLVRKTAGATAALTAAPMITSVITSAYAQSAESFFVCETEKCVDGSEGDVWCSRNFEGTPHEDSCECLGCHDLAQEGIIEDEDECEDAAVICTDEEIANDLFGCVERGEPGGEPAKDLREGMCIDLGGDT